MGIGTTGKVCKIINRNFIGIEIVKTYYQGSLNIFSKQGMHIGSLSFETRHIHTLTVHVQFRRIAPFTYRVHA